MIDRKTMRSLLAKMELAAQETLQQDSVFHKALRALKREIDNDPVVQSTVNELHAAGRRVFSSFVPHIEIRVRTEEGIFALPRPAIPVPPPVEQVGRLTQELREAASVVIKKSRYYRELGIIVNHAVGDTMRWGRAVTSKDSPPRSRARDTKFLFVSISLPMLRSTLRLQRSLRSESRPRRFPLQSLCPSSSRARTGSF
jgi:hypothetical protein